MGAEEGNNSRGAESNFPGFASLEAQADAFAPRSPMGPQAEAEGGWYNTLENQLRGKTSQGEHLVQQRRRNR